MTGTALVIWRKHYTKAKKPPKASRSICEVLRELYRDAEARSDALSMARIDEATDMAKRMDQKLAKHREPFVLANGVEEPREKPKVKK